MNLIAGHIYWCDEMLVEANHGDDGWSLLCLDPATGAPRPPAPGALNSYIHVRGGWYEVLYKDFYGQRFVSGRIEIDVTQFQDIAVDAAQDWIVGHLYTDGQHHYFAAEPGPPFVTALLRINIANGMWGQPITAETVLGYYLDEKRHWYALWSGNVEQSRSLHLAPYFATRILPKIEYVGPMPFDTPTQD